MSDVGTCPTCVPKGVFNYSLTKYFWLNKDREDLQKLRVQTGAQAESIDSLTQEIERLRNELTEKSFTQPDTIRLRDTLTLRDTIPGDTIRPDTVPPKFRRLTGGVGIGVLTARESATLENACLCPDEPIGFNEQGKGGLFILKAGLLPNFEKRFSLYGEVQLGGWTGKLDQGPNPGRSWPATSKLELGYQATLRDSLFGQALGLIGGLQGTSNNFNPARASWRGLQGRVGALWQLPSKSLVTVIYTTPGLLSSSINGDKASSASLWDVELAYHAEKLSFIAEFTRNFTLRGADAGGVVANTLAIGGLYRF